MPYALRSEMCAKAQCCRNAVSKSPISRLGDAAQERMCIYLNTRVASRAPMPARICNYYAECFQ